MAFVKVQTGDRVTDQIQNNISTAITPLLNCPIFQGAVLTNVQLSVGQNQINHKLSRNLQGWFIVRKRAQADIWDTQDSNTSQSTTLVINASASVSVDIWVY